MQKQVKIINVTAERFGIFKALELDFEKFKQGVIAFKGNAGQGKSTAQNAIKMGTQGRSTLADSSQYGEDWQTETQLLDGDRKIFIGGQARNGRIEYKLYEKDSEGKKVMNPIIDGVKATPAKYMELISTELTFGIRDFLSDNNTVHKKFMFDLFRPELEKLGVIFDKKNSEYEKSILGQLDQLTAKRDQLRARCQHSGAFATDFERDGLKLEQISVMEKVDIESLNIERNQLLIEKGQAESKAELEYNKAVSAITEKGQILINEARDIIDRLNSDYNTLKREYDEKISNANDERNILEDVCKNLENLSFLKKSDPNTIFGLKRDLNTFRTSLIEAHLKYYNIGSEPQKPILPTISEGKLIIEQGVQYHSDLTEVLAKRVDLAKEFSSIKKPEVNLSEYDIKIESLDKKISSSKVNNEYIDRYELNREWVEACGLVQQKRNELAKLYAQVNTGVEGLHMKPFFDEDGKMEIKTVYNGAYDPKFFENEKAEDRLLVAHSSTQKPLIGVLLQVARLKTKEKVLPYIFLDDVPMCSRSRELITRITAENNLTIITSITGDFDKDKLTENELLVEGGEIFFNN